MENRRSIHVPYSTECSSRLGTAHKRDGGDTPILDLLSSILNQLHALLDEPADFFELRGAGGTDPFKDRGFGGGDDSADVFQAPNSAVVVDFISAGNCIRRYINAEI